MYYHDYQEKPDRFIYMSPHGLMWNFVARASLAREYTDTSYRVNKQQMFISVNGHWVYLEMSLPFYLKAAHVQNTR